MKVVETIHHGNYRNTRSFEFSGPVSELDALEIVAHCPYKTPGRIAPRLAMCLNSGGSYSCGWVAWEVVPD